MTSHRETHYKKDWETEFPWLMEVKSNNLQAHCSLCKSTFRINGSGRSQVVAHGKGKHHEEMVKLSIGSPVQATLEKQGDNIVLVKGPLKEYFNFEEKTLKAEIIWALKCVSSTYSFSSNTGLNNVFKEMFSDSEIAKNYQMSATKARYTVQFGIAPVVLDILKEDCKRSPFCFKFDETTTSQVKKQYDGYIQYFSDIHQKIVSRYSGTIFVGHCDADHLRENFWEFVRKLKLNIDYLLQIGMDGPYVNNKFHRDLEVELRENFGKQLLNIGTCSLHPVHTAFKNGLKKIAFNYDKFAQDVHFFFKYSAARREDYVLANLESELETHYMLRHCQSRWLSLKEALIRIIQQWTHLKEYFLTFLPKQRGFAKDIESTERYQFIQSTLRNNTSPIYISFAIHLAEILETFLIPMQSDKPLIHTLFSNISGLLFKLFSCFIKSKLLKSTENQRYDASILGNLELASPNIQKLHDIDFGTKTKYLIANLESSANLDVVKSSFLLCFIEVGQYLQENLPHNSTFLKDLSCFQPSERHNSRSVAAAGRVALLIRNVLKATPIFGTLDMSSQTSSEWNIECTSPIILCSPKLMKKMTNNIGKLFLK